MPNIKGAWKRMRTSEEARQRNIAVKSHIRSLRRKFMEAATAKDKAALAGLYREYCSALDKAAKKGMIKKNAAVRRKTRAGAWLKSLA